MGGRGSNGGVATKSYEKTIMDHGPIRIKYSQLKNEYSGAEKIRDSYDPNTKTIQISITPLAKHLMENMPERDFKGFMDADPVISKYQAATWAESMITDQVRAGETPIASDPKWYKDAYKIAQAQVKFNGYFNWKTGKFVKQR